MDGFAVFLSMVATAGFLVGMVSSVAPLRLLGIRTRSAGGKVVIGSLVVLGIAIILRNLAAGQM